MYCTVTLSDIVGFHPGVNTLNNFKFFRNFIKVLLFVVTFTRCIYMFKDVRSGLPKTYVFRFSSKDLVKKKMKGHLWLFFINTPTDM